MNKRKVVFFEDLTLPVLIYLIVKRTFTKKDLKIYFIESSFLTTLSGFRFLQKRLNIEKFEFRLKDLKDSRGESIQERIRRLDLFEFEKCILESESFNSFFESLRSNHTRLKTFMVQSLINESQLDRKSIHRFILLLEAISLSHQKCKNIQITFTLAQRPWFDLYEKWGLKYDVDVRQRYTLSPDLILQHFPRVYLFLKYFLQLFANDLYIAKTNNNLYVDGRGDINFSNDGYHSDYFWYLNSNFPSRKIITEAKNDLEAKYFEKNNTSSSFLKFNLHKNFPTSLNSFNLNYLNESHKALFLSMKRYETLKIYWKAIFTQYDIKTYLTWNKYNETHIAKSDAIDDLGGVSAIWQLAFDGFKIINARYNVDVNYAFSDLSVNTDVAGGSVATYQIISGYPKRYARNLLSNQATEIRDKILLAGAKQIIFAIDENSLDDDRWHTGHSLQIENYQKPLEFIMKNKDFGLIFKPKNGKDLKNRLDSYTYKLLSQAIQTGRCVLLDDLGIRDFTTSAPPLLAAMVCDFCIHGHFGTAAMEAAFINKPTIMIDREGSPFHVFYELFNENIIFQNWEQALDATEAYFNSKHSELEIGNWSQSISELDPFDDNLGAKRIGDHLADINKGLDQGLSKCESLEKAAEKYIKNWGSDKVIYSKPRLRLI